MPSVGQSGRQSTKMPGRLQMMNCGTGGSSTCDSSQQQRGLPLSDGMSLDPSHCSLRHKLPAVAWMTSVCSQASSPKAGGRGEALMLPSVVARCSARCTCNLLDLFRAQVVLRPEVGAYAPASSRPRHLGSAVQSGPARCPAPQPGGPSSRGEGSRNRPASKLGHPGITDTELSGQAREWTDPSWLCAR